MRGSRHGSLSGSSGRLQRDPERSRAALIEAIGLQIVLRPDDSRRFLWAEYGLEEQRLVAAVGMPEIMVAGGCFELYSAYPISVPAVLASIATE